MQGSLFLSEDISHENPFKVSSYYPRPHTLEAQ